MSDNNFDASSVTGLNDLASAEVMQLQGFHGGDPVIGLEMQSTLQNAVGHVSRVSREAVAMRDKLKADDVMNPAGRDRMLSELAPNLQGQTDAQLRQAEIAVDILEARHTAVALHYDGKDAALLREEINNYMAGATPNTAPLRVVQLTSNPRFTTILAGPFGESIAARYGLDHSMIHRTALQTVAEHGNSVQVRAAKALAQVPAARRVIALARAGRDNAVNSLRGRQ
jgi:hypothetical protein